MTTHQAAQSTLAPVRGAEGLSEIAGLGGPCLTLIVPDRHPGAPEASIKMRIRALVEQAATGVLKDAGVAFAEGLKEGGGSGLIAFVTGAGTHSYRHGGSEARAVAGPAPYVLPVIEEAYAGQPMLIVALSTKHVQVFEYENGSVRQMALPAGVPKSLESAGHFHTGNVPSQGQTSGGGHGVKFGTSGEREAARSSVEHYCALIDHGLREALGSRPLLLMGVKEEIAAFRRVSHCPALLHAEVDGNVETLTPSEISARAHHAAVEEYRRAGSGVLSEFQEMRDRQRTLTNPREVLEAAGAGRVHQVCLRAETEIVGEEGTDLANLIAVETLRRGGEVYILPQHLVPVTQAVNAILRY